MGTASPFPGGIARSGHDAYHSPPSSAAVVMSRSYTSSPRTPMVCSGTALPFVYGIIKMYLSDLGKMSCFMMFLMNSIQARTTHLVGYSEEVGHAQNRLFYVS
jgi:hypothetical protein